MPAKKAKRTTEEKKLLAGPCYICEKKGCQMACLHCGIAFHPHCDMHDHCPNAPAQDGDGEQDMGGVGPAMPPCDGKCGSIYANTGECGCTDEMCACGSIVQYATDGDKRRGAAYRSLTDRVVNVPGFRFLQIRVLHGEATVTKDLRHILKRFVRRLFSANPISIYGIAVDTNVLLLLANALSTASRLNAAFKEEDFMSVPNALTIIDGMTE